MYTCSAVSIAVYSFSVVSGVPQGTDLGLCLFLIHLMGISSNLSAGTTASSFADDNRLLRGISDEDDCEILQEDLDQIYSWTEDIGMQFKLRSSSLFDKIKVVFHF